MSLVDGADAIQGESLAAITEIKEVGKRDVNKMLKEGWVLLAVATTRAGDFNYALGRNA